MRILLADDNGEIRAALRLLLEELGEEDILEAADAGRAMEISEQAPVDLVLLDWELPGRPSQPEGGTARLVRGLKEKAPACRVIAMSSIPEVDYASVLAGCDGFIGRTDPPDRLVALLRGEREGRV
jgi:CheY-like chemotaxis protein